MTTKKYCAVVDTNVLVSALITSNREAATVQVLKMLLAGKFIPVYSSAVLAEYRAVLRREKFNLNINTIEFLIAAIEKFGWFIEPSESGEALPDVKDLPFYEIVLEIKNNDGYLITGNLKHFPERPYIVTAREFVDMIWEQCDKYAD